MCHIPKPTFPAHLSAEAAFPRADISPTLLSLPWLSDVLAPHELLSTTGQLCCVQPRASNTDHDHRLYRRPQQPPPSTFCYCYSKTRSHFFGNCCFIATNFPWQHVILIKFNFKGN